MQNHPISSYMAAASSCSFRRFQGYGGNDGANPTIGKLALDQAGNFYGATTNGGTYGFGTVYKLSRSGGSWVETILYNFGAYGSGDGEWPVHSPVLDSVGNLYGTTEYGGINGAGTVYQLVPNGSGWTENIIAKFAPTDNAGKYPEAGLIIDQAGNLYGATSESAAGGGSVFELSPSGNSWQLTVLYSFSHPNGYGPIGNLVMDDSGNLYGTTYSLGAGWGNIFKLTRSGSGWAYSDLYDFYPGDGANPTGDLTVDANGNVYGTTQNGGNAARGVIWEITP